MFGGKVEMTEELTNKKLVDALMQKLQAEVKDVKTHFHALKDDNAFVLWFADAYLIGNRERAFEGITGSPGDKTVDAAYIDERNRVIELVQGKYHLNGDANDDEDVYRFARRARDFWNRPFEKELENAGPGAKKRLTEVHKLLHGDNGYKLKLYFASSGKITPQCKSATKKICLKANKTELEILDRMAILGIFADWLEGSSPPLPKLQLGVDGHHTLLHKDGKTGLQGWIFTTSAQELVKLFEQAEERLFARNVRGFLGNDTSINKEIGNTASRTPDRFWFMNNGITIVADNVEKIQSGSAIRMHMINPQVVNGQQTVRTLVDIPKNSSRVLVRLIRLDKPLAKEGMVGVVGEVVRATNRQNAIKQADLMANDTEQVRIERELRKLRYAYERKREDAKEFSPKAFKHTKIKREELANALSTTFVGAHLVRRSEQWESRYAVLFNERRPNSDYLVRWWLARIIKEVPSATPEARWVVLQTIWKWSDFPMRECFKTEGNRQAFIRSCEGNEANVLRHIRGAAKQIFIAGRSTYVAARKAFAKEMKESGKPFKVLTPDAFFRREAAHSDVVKSLCKDLQKKKAVTSALKQVEVKFQGLG